MKNLTLTLLIAGIVLAGCSSTNGQASLYDQYKDEIVTDSFLRQQIKDELNAKRQAKCHIDHPINGTDLQECLDYYAVNELMWCIEKKPFPVCDEVGKADNECLIWRTEEHCVRVEIE